jgi:hypothetical protein
MTIKGGIVVRFFEMTCSKFSVAYLLYILTTEFSGTA